jgi:acetyl esterase/lipase
LQTIHQKTSFPDWQDYSQTELDAQYNQASLVSNVGEIIQQQNEQGTRFREKFIAEGGLVRTLEMAEPDLKIDLFSAVKSPFGLVFFIPGGAWLKEDSWQSIHSMAEPIVTAGAGFAVLRVKTAHTHSLHSLCEQVVAATSYLAGQADQLGVAADTIILAGHSSGAHLASVAGTRLAARQPGLLRHLFFISGMYDLTPVRASARNDYLHLGEDEVPPLSALANIHSHLPPISLRVSSSELTEFRRQSAAFAEALAGQGREVDYRELEGCNHFTILAPAAAELARLVASL